MSRPAPNRSLLALAESAGPLTTPQSHNISVGLPLIAIGIPGRVMEPEAASTEAGPGPETSIDKPQEEDRESLVQLLPSLPENGGIHKLPREVTNMIWPQASVWPTDPWGMTEIGRRWLVPGSALVCWCFPLPAGGYRMPYFSGHLYARKNEDALGMASVLYTLSPPPIAQVCRETRAYALDRFGLDEDTSEGRQKWADSLRRWENEYMVTAIFAMMTQWPGRNQRLDIKACLSSAASFKSNQLILDLATLNKGYNRADYSAGKLENPLLQEESIGRDIFDLLSTAQDYQILVAYPRTIQLVAHSEAFSGGDSSSQAKFLRSWIRRKSRYVRLDDAVVWGALSSMGLKQAPFVSFHDNPLERHRGLLPLRKITERGPEGRERLKDKALQPFRELWEKRCWEQPPPLKPFPHVEVVIAVSITRRGQAIGRWPFWHGSRSDCAGGGR